MTSHRRQNLHTATIAECLVDAAIGTFLGVTGGLVVLLAALWVWALFGIAW